MGDHPLQQKSFDFALAIVSFCRRLSEEKREFVLSDQLLRSGTSIGANIEEAQQARSKKDFISKLSISAQESYEARFWIRLIATSYMDYKEICDQLSDQLQEIIRMLVASLKTSKVDQ